MTELPSLQHLIAARNKCSLISVDDLDYECEKILYNVLYLSLIYF